MKMVQYNADQCLTHNDTHPFSLCIANCNKRIGILVNNTHIWFTVGIYAFMEMMECEVENSFFYSKSSFLKNKFMHFNDL